MYTNVIVSLNDGDFVIELALPSWAQEQSARTMDCLWKAVRQQRPDLDETCGLAFEVPEEDDMWIHVDDNSAHMAVTLAMEGKLHLLVLDPVPQEVTPVEEEQEDEEVSQWVDILGDLVRSRDEAAQACSDAGTRAEQAEQQVRSLAEVNQRLGQENEGLQSILHQMLHNHDQHAQHVEEVTESARHHSEVVQLVRCAMSSEKMMPHVLAMQQVLLEGEGGKGSEELWAVLQAAVHDAQK